MDHHSASAIGLKRESRICLQVMFITLLHHRCGFQGSPNITHPCLDDPDATHRLPPVDS